ncbi:hypothetical protein GCM10020229_28140 [Kitasatospora albolonga]|uniref:hypothetical protein n=1 Tax=Kitasatospora albolonga TaxID=68173 RepID=UPI0031EE8FD1
MLLVLGLGTGFVSALCHTAPAPTGCSPASPCSAPVVQIYFLGYLAQWGLVHSTGLLPLPAYTPPATDPAAWVGGMLLPWLVLGFVNSAVFARLSRAPAAGDHGRGVRPDRARQGPEPAAGPPEVHGARGAAGPLVQLLGLEAGALLGGAVITETVFGLNGVGTFAAEAVAGQDLPRRGRHRAARRLLRGPLRGPGRPGGGLARPAHPPQLTPPQELSR